MPEMFEIKFILGFFSNSVFLKYRGVTRVQRVWEPSPLDHNRIIIFVFRTAPVVFRDTAYKLSKLGSVRVSNDLSFFLLSTYKMYFYGPIFKVFFFNYDPNHSTWYRWCVTRIFETYTQCIFRLNVCFNVNTMDLYEI